VADQAAQTQAAAKPFGPTLEGLRRGAMLAMPLVPGTFVFALANGALSAQRGLSVDETFGMSAILFAGASQAMAYQIWPSGAWSLGVLLAMVGVVAAVNARMFLMGVSLRPWLSHAPPALIYPNLALLTDMNWSVSMAYRARGGNDVGVFLGAGLLSFVAWVPFCMIGYFATSYVPDPRKYALDLMMVVMFSAMSINIFKRARSRTPFVAAGAATLAASYALPGFWFTIVGALAGAGYAAMRGGDA
jgi:predicted branched-subunit amino acid permease